MNSGLQLGLISAALSCLVSPVWGRSAGLFPEQQLVIEPSLQLKSGKPVQNLSLPVLSPGHKKILQGFKKVGLNFIVK